MSLFYCIQIGICQHIMWGTCSKSIMENFSIFLITSVYKRAAKIVRIQFLYVFKDGKLEIDFPWAVLLLTRNCLFVYFCTRLSQVSLIWCDIFVFFGEFYLPAVIFISQKCWKWICLPYREIPNISSRFTYISKPGLIMREAYLIFINSLQATKSCKS